MPAVVSTVEAVVSPHHDVRGTRPDLMVATRTPIRLDRPSAGDIPYQVVAARTGLNPLRRRRCQGPRRRRRTRILSGHDASVFQGPNSDCLEQPELVVDGSLEGVVIKCETADSAVIGERLGLRLDLLRREYPGDGSQ